jgi:hypothetical protein
MNRIKHLGLVAAVATGLLFGSVVASSIAAADPPKTTTTTSADGHYTCTTTTLPGGSQWVECVPKATTKAEPRPTTTEPRLTTTLVANRIQ